MKKYIIIVVIFFASCFGVQTKNDASQQENFSNSLSQNDLKNTKWRLVKIDNEVIKKEHVATLSFNSSDGNKLEVNGTCFVNSFFGDAYVSDNNIKFDKVGHTLMASIDNDLNILESKYLQLLSTNVTFKFENKELIIIDPNKSVYTFNKQ